MACNTEKIKDVSVVSPFGRRWHIHVKLPHSKDNKKRFKNLLFLKLATKAWKVSQLDKCIIDPKLRNKPYYIAKQAYTKALIALTESRVRSSDFKRLLFIKQDGICTHCSLPLELDVLNHDETLWLNDYYSDRTEIYHIKPIGEDNRLGDKIHKEYNDIQNLVLLHKDCHYEITYNLS